MGFKGFRARKKLTKKEEAKLKESQDKQMEVFKVKCDEYENMSLEELKMLYNSNKRPGGSYLQALLTVVNNKLKKEAESNLVDKIEELKEIKEENNGENS